MGLWYGLVDIIQYSCQLDILSLYQAFELRFIGHVFPGAFAFPAHKYLLLSCKPTNTNHPGCYCLDKMTSQDSSTAMTGEQPDNPTGVIDEIEGFTPLEPAPGEAVQSASRRLQDIRVSKFSHAFGHVVAQQWRVDLAAGRDTWAVVDSMLECKLLHRGLLTARALEGLETSMGQVLIADNDKPWE